MNPSGGTSKRLKLSLTGSHASCLRLGTIRFWSRRRYSNNFCTTVSAHNGAFYICRPTSIGPGTGDEEIGDRTALKRATGLNAWLVRQAPFFISLGVK